MSAPKPPISIKTDMRLFGKKKTREPKRDKPDFSKYKVKINGKTMCAYESMTGKPFMKIETEDEIKHLFYCSLVVNNEDFSTLEYKVFEYLITDPEVMNWMSEEYVKIGRFLSQFKGNVGEREEEKKSKGDEEENTFYMLEAITGLIVRMGLDPNYVMYGMEEWEISYYYRMMQDMDRERLTEGRLWTYLQVLPHIGKKLSGPEKLLPFPWEKSEKEKKEEELNKNTAAAFAFLGGQRNGTKQSNNSTGQEGPGSGEQLAVPNGESGPE